VFSVFLWGVRRAALFTVVHVLLSRYVTMSTTALILLPLPVVVRGGAGVYMSSCTSFRGGVCP